MAKDQGSIDEPSSYEKWERAKSLFLESLHKPDTDLRGCAHNQHCFCLLYTSPSPRDG